MSEADIKELTRPLTRTGKAYYFFVGTLSVVVAWAAYAWWTQLKYGLVVTGMRDMAIWGFYISTFIFAIGTASAGMSIGLLARVGKIKEFEPIERLSELVCVVFLALMFLFVVFDLGRPDRLLNLFIYGQIVSPLYWDIVIVTLYFILSAISLLLPLRGEVGAYIDKVSGWRRILYRILSLGYKEEDGEVIDRTRWWLAIGILLTMTSVHAGVVPWIFGLISARAGWYNAFYAPYFGLAHVFNGFAVVIIIVAAVRYFLNLQEYIKPETFKKLGLALLILTVLYVHFMISEQLTMRFAPPTAEFEVSQEMLFGSWGWAYWVALALLIESILILVSPLRSTVRGVVIAGIFTTIALWLKRIVIILPPLIRPTLTLYPPGSYIPTWVEVSITIGAFTLGILIMTIFIKLFPIIELKILKGEGE